MRVRVRVRAAAHAARVVRVERAEVVHLSVQSGRVLSVRHSEADPMPLDPWLPPPRPPWQKGVVEADPRRNPWHAFAAAEWPDGQAC